VYSDDEVTEATSSRSSMPPERLRTIEDPSLPPASGASSVLWVSAGIVVLLGGAWLLAVSGSNGSAAVEPAAEAPPQVAPADPKLVKAAPPAEPKPVQVRVFSDVRDAVLLVNGEPHGPLTIGQAASMELKPGAYRFEAQANGNIAAVEVATVRPEVPLDVTLKLPTGHSAEGENKPAEPSQGPAVAAPVTSEQKPEHSAEAEGPKKGPHASSGAEAQQQTAAENDKPKEPAAEKPVRTTPKKKAPVAHTSEEPGAAPPPPAPAPDAPAQAAPPPAQAAPPPAQAAPPPAAHPAPPATPPAQPPAEKPQPPGIPDNPF
jgi:hypothetical protein